MSKVRVTNPHPRVLNLAHAGDTLMLVPGRVYEVEEDATVKALLKAGDLQASAAAPAEEQEPEPAPEPKPEPEEAPKPAKAPAKKGK